MVGLEGAGRRVSGSVQWCSFGYVARFDEGAAEDPSRDPRELLSRQALLVQRMQAAHVHAEVLEVLLHCGEHGCRGALAVRGAGRLAP